MIELIAHNTNKSISNYRCKWTQHLHSEKQKKPMSAMTQMDRLIPMQSEQA
jgi:hypothetical protein